MEAIHYTILHDEKHSDIAKLELPHGSKPMDITSFTDDVNMTEDGLMRLHDLCAHITDCLVIQENLLQPPTTAVTFALDTLGLVARPTRIMTFDDSYGLADGNWEELMDSINYLDHRDVLSGVQKKIHEAYERSRSPVNKGTTV